MKNPNFFIIGAPKSGTTALSVYLKEHPNVFMSTPKEPHYFASDMIRHRSVESIEDYLALFDKAGPSHNAIGEASVWYMYSKNAIKNIHLYDPNAKIIVMLRKPVDMVHSLHAQLIQSLGEDCASFEKAWDLEGERKKGQYIPTHVLHVPNLFYSEVARYYTQLVNVYKYYDESQVKIILFDDFVRNTERVFDETVEFLCLRPYQKSNFEKVNQNAAPRSRFFSLLIKKRFGLPSILRSTIKQNLPFFKGISQKLYFINTLERQRAPMHEVIRRRVVQHYEQEVMQLGALLKKDLAEWNVP